MANIDDLASQLEERGVDIVNRKRTATGYRIFGEYEGSRRSLQRLTPRVLNILHFNGYSVAFEVADFELTDGDDPVEPEQGLDFTDPFEGNQLAEGGQWPEEEVDRQEAEDESDVCDCDPSHKETQVIQESTGAKIGPIGGNRGDGTPVIICKNCGHQFEVKEKTGGVTEGGLF